MSRTFVITGAASGIGKTTTSLLRDLGDTVIGVDLKDTEVIGDLSTLEGRQAAASRATNLAGGSVDAVITCAGLSLPKPITAIVNYFGMVDFLEAMRPALARSEAPRAALISSVASVQPVNSALVSALLSGDEAASAELAAALSANPQEMHTIYSSSKRGTSRWVRREAPSERWAGAGIPLNAVGPGTVLTPMTADLLSSTDTTAVVDAAVPMPLHGHQPAESVARLLIWLTSLENTHCCGQTIYCDGGAEAIVRGDDIWSWNEAAMNERFAVLGA